MDNGHPTWHQEYQSQLRYQISILQTMAAQAQSRAQATSTSLTLVISLGGIVVASDKSIQQYIRLHQLGGWLIVGVIGMVLSLLITLMISVPSLVTLTGANSFRELETPTDELYQAIDESDPDDRNLLAKFDSDLVSFYSQLQASSANRGKILLGAQALLAGSILLVGTVLLIPLM